jgi:hypothetical protein
MDDEWRDGSGPHIVAFPFSLHKEHLEDNNNNYPTTKIFFYCYAQAENQGHYLKKNIVIYSVHLLLKILSSGCKTM